MHIFLLDFRDLSGPPAGRGRVTKLRPEAGLLLASLLASIRL